jgi:anti-anti-sigma factor
VVERSAHTLLVDHRDRGRPVGLEDPIAVWIGEAIRRRQRVLYELEPAESRDSVFAALLGCQVGGQVEVLESAAVRAESSGTAEGLALMHRSRSDEAHGQGWSGLAVVTGSAVLAAVSAGTDTAVLHEQGVSRMVVEAGMSALCRYRPDHQPELAAVMLAGHFKDVDDEIWGTRVVAGVLHLRGEIDASNNDRVAHVLLGALDAGVRVVDLSELQFCAAAGVRALVRAADSLPTGDALVIANADVTLQHLFSVVGLPDHPSVELREEPR